ncbi:MAG TPA: hypothetical protein PLQ01_03290 [Methanothrix sp.]|jgi:hypothetical protein|nr:hypothetical protein [Methanothrix sp.]HOV81687.1 hypothetical protein [Methanothrix sp.]HPC89191.1 hypothetical protein [Methanothrix sp.]HQI67772.1 hypothetical protein [Methanothrix sp.]HRS84421.1 hypothetical protein [Methanothrix sp.]
MMRLINLIAVAALILSAGSPAAGRCCSLGGGASYDFLGDPAMSMDMSSYDEFLRDYGKDSVSAGDEAQPRRLIIHLNDSAENASFDLRLSAKGSGLSGAGNMTSSQGGEPVSADGRLVGGNLTLNVTAYSGGIFTLELAGAEGNGGLIGSFVRRSRAVPGQIGLMGTAEGRWEQ